MQTRSDMRGARARRFVPLALLAAAAVWAAGDTPGPGASQERWIRLRTAEFRTDGLSSGQLPLRLSSRAGWRGLLRTPFARDTTDLFIVQLRGPITEAMRAEVESVGRIVSYVPDDAYLVRLDEAGLREVRRLAAHAWSGLFQPAFRLEPELETKRRAGAQVLDVALALAVPEEADSVRRRLRALGAELPALESAQGPAAALRAWLPARALEALADDPAILWVEEHFEPELQNNVARSSGSVATGRNEQAGPVMDVERVWAKGIRGESQIVAISDSGLDTGDVASLHLDYGKVGDAGNPMRVIAMLHRDLEAGTALWNNGRNTARDAQICEDEDGEPQEKGSHGTHVAGSVTGSGILSGANPGQNLFPTTAYSGTAPKASVVFQSVMDGNCGLGGIPADRGKLFRSAYLRGARVENNSWGGGVHGSYNVGSVTSDAFVWAHQDMLLVFAAGNDGTDKNPADGIVDPTSVLNPGTAKNVLTVGATENYRPTAAAHSRSCDREATTYFGMWREDYSFHPIGLDHLANHASGMAAFSGRGPALDGRVKPDLVAPGAFILSTKSTLVPGSKGVGQCGLSEQDARWYHYNLGTSMATPLAAGAAVLVRQYFADGWHPNFSDTIHTAPRSSDGFEASAALVKAVLLNGAFHMTPGQYGTEAHRREIPPHRPNNVTG
jgi:subtilisin family serine protease